MNIFARRLSSAKPRERISLYRSYLHKSMLYAIIWFMNKAELPTPEQTLNAEPLPEETVRDIGDTAMQASESSNEPIQPRQRISDDHIFSKYALRTKGGQVLSPRKTPNTDYASLKRNNS